MSVHPLDIQPPRAVVIGYSAGGFSVIKKILSGLPADLQVPIVVVNHLGAGESQLAELLDRYSVLPVHEVGDKLVMQPGHVYVAIPEYHVLIEPDMSLSLSVDAPVHFCRPAIDVLFESAADSLGAQVVAILLTGANVDGAEGLKLIRSKGGVAIVQDPDDAEVATMPEAAIAIAGADHILPESRIAGALVRILDGEKP